MGIFGYCVSKNFKSTQLKNMEKALFTSDKVAKNKSYVDENVEISQISLKEFMSEPLLSQDVVLYLDGEIYNFAQIKDAFDLKSDNFQDALVECHKKNLLTKFLNRTNGQFSGCLYDKIAKKIFLFTDRLGLGFIYYYFKDGNFAFSSKMQSIISLENTDKTLNKKSLKSFFDLGYLFGDNTWFEHIKLIKPASVIEFDLNSKVLKQDFYWKFSEIKKQKLSFDEAAKKLGEIFIAAVSKRLDTSKFYAVPTSGGRDSRMIVAAINKIAPNLKTYNYTMGSSDCGDVQIASEVCNVANQKHDVYLFDNENWFEKRIDTLKNAECAYSIKHLHGCEFISQIAKHSPLIFHGFPAGEFFWDYLKIAPNHLNTRISKEIVKASLKKHADLATDIDDDFYDINHFEPYFYTNRLRRFGMQNLATLDSEAKFITPFCDNEIIDFIFSLPDEYRRNGIYAKALYDAFPLFYKKIPWQRTGLTLNFEIKIAGKYKLLNSIRKIPIKFAKKINSIKLALKKGKPQTDYFLDYAEEIKIPELRKKLEELLDPKTSAYSKFSDNNYVEQYLNPHLRGEKDYNEKILTIASFELYFRGVLNEHTV